MTYRNCFHCFLIILLCLSCSKKEIEKSKIEEVNLESQMIEAYEEGLKELKAGDVIYAAKKFNEAEILFPQSEYEFLKNELLNFNFDNKKNDLANILYCTYNYMCFFIFSF